MPPSEQTREFRTLERQRMIRVKDALAAGIAAQPPATDFMAACVDYLEFIVGRFVRQGVANAERLRVAVPSMDTASQQILADIERTLARTRMQLQELIAARDSLRAGDGGNRDFCTASQAFLAFYNQSLAQRKNPAQEIIAKYIDPEVYWKQTDDVTSETIDTEARLFEKLRATAPPGIQLEESG